MVFVQVKASNKTKLKIKQDLLKQTQQIACSLYGSRKINRKCKNV